ncbi:hypothetical protein [Enterococcus mundtii]|uniref:hypothetical protein n=1 Tax=Enterococcus mundtii TaxID=53346 RepID=UPI001F49B65E|nr:hypothetical protein [Enterococcus mundtii]
MELFDVTKYQLPKDVDIEWETTKEKFSIFLSEYKNLREKVGIPATPRIQKNIFDDNNYPCACAPSPSLERLLRNINPKEMIEMIESNLKERVVRIRELLYSKYVVLEKEYIQSNKKLCNISDYVLRFENQLAEISTWHFEIELTLKLQNRYTKAIFPKYLRLLTKKRILS